MRSQDWLVDRLKAEGVVEHADGAQGGPAPTLSACCMPASSGGGAGAGGCSTAAAAPHATPPTQLSPPTKSTASPTSLAVERTLRQCDRGHYVDSGVPREYAYQARAGRGPGVGSTPLTLWDAYLRACVCVSQGGGGGGGAPRGRASSVVSWDSWPAFPAQSKAQADTPPRLAQQQRATFQPKEQGLPQSPRPPLPLFPQDAPLPIGHQETISAPHMHATCLELLRGHLRPGARVLDVGSGGYE
jgi:hypothetical protein